MQVDTGHITGNALASGLVITGVVPPVNFGTINTGTTATDTLVLRDTGTETICITNVNTKPPFAVSGDHSKTLLPGDTMRRGHFRSRRL